MNNLNLSRRKFIAAAGASAALASQAFTGSVRAQNTTMAGKKYPIGIELYSVRGELARDLMGTLTQVAEIGYDSVEFYAPYYEWEIPYAKEVKTHMDDLGLRCYSTHNHIESYTPGEQMDHAIELNQILGCRYVVLSSAPGRVRSGDDWMRLFEQLSAAQEIYKTHGLKGGFHNHQTEWRAPQGYNKSIMDLMAENTPKDFSLQFDVGTCMQADTFDGVDTDPVAWIRKNPGRINSMHLKDWGPGEESDEKGYRVLFGEGVTPWKELFAAAEEVGGIEHYIMEQEGSRFSEFETAERCLATWKEMRRSAA